MKEVFAVMAAVLQVVAMVPYIVSIFRGETKPVKATWLIWAVLDTITVASMVAKGTWTYQIWLVVGLAWTTAALSFWYGLSGWALIDKVCLGGAALAVCMWFASGDPLVAMIISLTATLLGSLPTFASALEDPGRENKLGWSIGTACNGFALLAVKEWTAAGCSQQLVFMAIQLVMMHLLFLQPRLSRRQRAKVDADLDRRALNPPAPFPY